MTIVKCSGVKKTYQQGKVEVEALRGIDMEVEKGEFIAIAGPSGSGKTTVLNLIGGLDDVSEGKIVVDGQDISRLKSSQLADMRLHKIGFIFQSY
ncbi:MAG TPA: ATP-binding cassette domain-containing protein, partial [Desulfobacteraceae bacterium]|nr:ATP-binding cassette domain-containing protein [Desulfobacteraceae bacterium]